MSQSIRNNLGVDIESSYVIKDLVALTQESSQRPETPNHTFLR